MNCEFEKVLCVNTVSLVLLYVTGKHVIRPND